MFSEKMYELGSKSSVIREIFEFGKKKVSEIGEENVYDFSIGNPSIPPPESVKNAILEILEDIPESVHGYTSAQGDVNTRKIIATSLNKRFGTNFTFENLYMTVGASASLSICFKAICTENDEFIVFAPFFPEYRCFVESAGGKLVVIPVQEKDFQINFDKFENALNENTKAVIVNSPNNPSGVVYSEETIKRLTILLDKKSKEYGHPIYLVSDEPYREVVYDNIDVPFLTKYYKNTFVCYSYSKSLSLPGERIGYLLVPDEISESKKVFAAVCGAGRSLGYVCAPSLFQKVIAKCVEDTGDISAYKENRDLLVQNLENLGYECIKPQGAFYLFMKTLEDDAYAFCEKAKQYNLLFVPGNDFGCEGYVRIAYCVNKKRIENSIPAFKKLITEYKK